MTTQKRDRILGVQAPRPSQFCPYMAVITPKEITHIEDYQDICNPNTRMAVVCSVDKAKFKKWAKWEFYIKSPLRKPDLSSNIWQIGNRSVASQFGLIVWEEMMQGYVAGDVNLFRIVDEPSIMAMIYFNGDRKYPAIIGTLDPNHQFTRITNKIMDRFLKRYWSKIANT